jgi:hypothetical protein
VCVDALLLFLTMSVIKQFSFPSFLPEDPYQWYLKNVIVSPKESKDISECVQGSQIWHRARGLRISGSRYANVIGCSYIQMTKKAVIESFVWPDENVSNLWMKWGNENEINAQKLCEEFITKKYPNEKIKFEYPGGIIIKGDEWFIASVDGICNFINDDGSVKESILLEFKCPANDIPALIQPYYYAQIQSYMGFLPKHDNEKYGTMKRCIFGVWTPEEMQFAQYEFDKEYFDASYSLSKDFYFKELLPRFVLKDHGLLFRKQINLQTQSIHKQEEKKRKNPQSTFLTQRKLHFAKKFKIAISEN